MLENQIHNLQITGGAVRNGIYNADRNQVQSRQGCDFIIPLKQTNISLVVFKTIYSENHFTSVKFPAQNL